MAAETPNDRDRDPEPPEPEPDPIERKRDRLYGTDRPEKAAPAKASPGCLVLLALPALFGLSIACGAERPHDGVTRAEEARTATGDVRLLHGDAVPAGPDPEVPPPA